MEQYLIGVVFGIVMEQFLISDYVFRRMGGAVSDW